MSIARRDYILRLIEQFAEALARIMGLRKAGKLDDAQKLASETADGIFGALRVMIDQVDASSAAALLGSREKISVYAALTAENAEIAAAKGDARKAQAHRRRALELFLEASRVGTLDTQSRATVESLRQTIDVERLGDRYRELIARLPTLTT
ncbi:MAG: hypothetical protein IPM54_31820 [Polyangiaceae bacterium]|nr:hypothetical protein [Polyangiaceae bacterium]